MMGNIFQKLGDFLGKSSGHTAPTSHEFEPLFKWPKKGKSSRHNSDLQVNPIWREIGPKYIFSQTQFDRIFFK